MLVGNKAKFAVELKFDQFYDDNFVASGAYRIYVNNFAYGYDTHYSTTYYMIVCGLKKLAEGKIMVENFFDQFSDYEIALNYQKATYEDADFEIKKYLGLDGKSFVDSFFDLRDYAESAFDDGSFMLLFCNRKIAKLIGFQMPLEKKTIINVNSVVLSRKEFDNIIKATLKTIFSEREKYFLQKGRV